MPSGVDLNRGVLSGRTRDGRMCNMYYDNPGVYFDNAGSELTEKDAESAGFVVEKWATARKRKALVDAALAAADRQEDPPSQPDAQSRDVPPAALPPRKRGRPRKSDAVAATP